MQTILYNNNNNNNSSNHNSTTATSQSLVRPCETTSMLNTVMEEQEVVVLSGASEGAAAAAAGGGETYATSSSIGASAAAADDLTTGHGMHSISRRDAEWISELPWINPLTRMSYEPGQGPSPVVATTTPSPSTLTSTTFFPQPVFQQTRHNYVFSHSASGFAKNPNRPPILTPEQDQAYFSVQVGEDSYFQRHDALGVADGVGANPALYSRKLMHYAFVELEKYDNIEEEAFYDYFNVNPVDILEKSYEQSTLDAKKEGLIGSSTACLAILRDDELRIANLGDCGISVIRNNEFIFRTEEQQHSFNYPYQLGTGSSDRPTDAQVFTVKVKNGDIVVMGTDGIFDNLFDEDILEEVVRCIDGSNPNEGLSPYGTGLPAATSTASKGMSSLWSGITSGAAKLASTSQSTIAAIAGKTTTSNTHANGIAAPADATTATTTNAGTTTSSSSAPTASTEVSQRLPSSVQMTVGGDEDVEPSDALTMDGGLSPIAAAAVAAAESSALPLSATLYHLGSGEGPFAGAGAGGARGTRGTYLSRSSYERKIPEPSVISDALAKRAKSVAEDSRHHGSPFQSRAMQEGLYYQGGKRDDMSVLVAIVKIAEDSPDRR
ncbi:hypothetical protein DFQ27_009255 [Actinomortierella ambigua]|uniref:Protein phosphatase n=1 Tax=Actinomortierella ambigua TaxID=1343610 RepID=A0A9P6QH13_9FUNG|nr:hypothetical protein DFQ27_009255 [Actinomortierella ambigua]